MSRYSLRASFAIEQRKGFVVHKTTSKDFETNDELNAHMIQFLSDYNHAYCHSLDFHVTEKEVATDVL